ncbi:Hypp1828 [Branchiostoma lanceolatum]|uniref:Hypp1828 protein n=1 Tax=Branchiostoma lanceolatum TaxID=7740 RepID=A0A8K0EMG8_BRALA|nr:Hypp1828 [Branchiostoma lanceolatum]
MRRRTPQRRFMAPTAGKRDSRLSSEAWCPYKADATEDDITRIWRTICRRCHAAIVRRRRRPDVRSASCGQNVTRPGTCSVKRAPGAVAFGDIRCLLPGISPPSSSPLTEYRYRGESANTGGPEHGKLPTINATWPDTYKTTQPRRRPRKAVAPTPERHPECQSPGNRCPQEHLSAPGHRRAPTAGPKGTGSSQLPGKLSS